MRQAQPECLLLDDVDCIFKQVKNITKLKVSALLHFFASCLCCCKDRQLRLINSAKRKFAKQIDIRTLARSVSNQ